MNVRTLIATATLIGLLAIPLLGESTYLTDQLADWGYFWGMRGTDLAAFGMAGIVVCASIAGIGSLICGGVGVG